MECPSQRPGSITFFLLGLIWVTAVGLFVSLAPVYRCPRCELDLAVVKEASPLWCGPATQIVTRDGHPCFHCNGHGRVTPLTHWLVCSKHARFNYFQF
jgi:hypothetical protein